MQRQGLIAPSSFKKEVCCEHRWRKSTEKDAPKGQQKCSNCGAVCERDKRGMIVEYFRPVTGFTNVND